MAASLEYTDDGGAIVTGTGTLVVSDVSSVNEQLYATEEAIQALKYQIVDLTAVTKFGVTADDVRRLAMEDSSAAAVNSDMLIAVVGEANIAYGLLRMWEMNIEEGEQTHQVFRKREEAEAWVREKLAENRDE